MKPSLPAALASAALLLAACSGSPGVAAQDDNGPVPSSPPATTPARASQPPFPSGLDPADFSDPIEIDNPWWPLVPGTRWTWEGEALDGDERVERRIIFTVTDLTKDIGGIPFIVGYDLDYNDDELIESELIFLAEDDAGNIWHAGQYTELWDAGTLDGGLAWLAGYVEGAKPGIMMPADPTPGTDQYIEGFAPEPYVWDDVARVDRVVDEVCVPLRCYRDVVIIREFEPTKPGAAQLKFWARGVGNIRVGWDGEDEEQEVLELISVQRLSDVELAEVRGLAMAMDLRARVYGATGPLVQR